MIHQPPPTWNPEDRKTKRQMAVLDHIMSTWETLNKDKTTKVQDVLLSRNQFAAALGCHRDTITPVLDELVEHGLLEREGYFLTKREKEHRWKWMYNITSKGVREWFAVA